MEGEDQSIIRTALVAGVSFDCDSTLTHIEGIDEIAKMHDVGNQVRAMTRGAMEGNMPFSEALQRRLNLIRPTREDLQTLAQRYRENAVEGIRELIEELRTQFHVRILIVSGGFRDAILPLAEDLGIDPEDVLAVRLRFNANGTYEGIDTDDPITNALLQEEGKRKAKELWSAQHPEVVLEIHVGDGATDLDPGKIPGVRVVGFGAVEVRIKVAQGVAVFCNTVVELREALKGFLGMYSKEEEALVA